MLIVNITTICSLGHGLCTFNAVPRSTQPSTLRGMRIEEKDKIRKAKTEEDERNRQFRLEETRIRENVKKQQ